MHQCHATVMAAGSVAFVIRCFVLLLNSTNFSSDLLTTCVDIFLFLLIIRQIAIG